MADAVFVVRNFTETAPMVSAVVADGRQIEVTFDQQVDGSIAPPSDFSVSAGRRPVNVASLDWSANSVTLTLAERVTSLDSVTLSYEAGVKGPVRDLSGLELAGIPDSCDQRNGSTEVDQAANRRCQVAVIEWRDDVRP